ncbi:MAG: glycosyltransferase [Planctomycetota bacterium]
MSSLNPREVSLYIPVRNAARTLAAAIESVRQQSIQPAEFYLVVDHRSCDASVEIARRSGLRLIEQNDGRLGHARNLAIEVCRTRWLASCDSDVALEPTWLAALLHSADEAVAAVGGCTHERLITKADRWRAINMPHNWGPLAFDNAFMLVSEMLADTQALRCIGGYRADLQAWEDSDACQRLRHAGYALRYEPSAVAYHDRRDSVASVLDLRALYSSYRQRTRLESLPGLISKFAINHTYCLQSLSQTLHSEHPDVCAISVLLWFHHARHDLRTALHKWPLLDEADLAVCVARLDAALMACLSAEWANLITPLRQLIQITDQTADAGARRGLAGSTGFEDYLVAARQATLAFLHEIPTPVIHSVIDSARRLTGADNDTTFTLPRLAITQEQEQRLTEQSLHPAWHWPQLAETLQSAIGPRVSTITPILYGSVHEREIPAASFRPEDGEPDGPRLVLIPHLENSTQPVLLLKQALAKADLAVLAYQPPRIFVPAVPILSARDLATCSAAAGFQIRHFHTEAGLTRLVLERDPATIQDQPKSLAAGIYH